MLLSSCNAFDGALLQRPVDPAGEGDGLTPRPDAGGDAGAMHGRDDGGAGVPNDGGNVPSSDASIRDDAGHATDAGADASANSDAALETDGAVDAGDAGGACTVASASDYCSALPMMAAAPVIDGVLDCGPPLSPIAPTAWNGATALPQGHSTQLAVAHRPDGIYIYVEVRGQAPAPHPSTAAIYCGDAIEIYLDADGVMASDGSYDVPGTMQLIAAAPASLAAPNPHAERYAAGATQGVWASTEYELAWFADGYALEAFVGAADLGLASWPIATALGIDLVIDVAGPEASPDLRCGRQLGQYFLRVSSTLPSNCNGEPWCDTRAFCVPALL